MTLRKRMRMTPPTDPRFKVIGSIAISSILHQYEKLHSTGLPRSINRIMCANSFISYPLASYHPTPLRIFPPFRLELSPSFSEPSFIFFPLPLPRRTPRISLFSSRLRPRLLRSDKGNPKRSHLEQFLQGYMRSGGLADQDQVG